MVWFFSLMLALSAISYSLAEVRVPPNIIEPGKVTVKYHTSNSNFVVPCRAESRPDPPMYKWLKGTTPIVPDQYVKFDATTGNLSFTGFTSREEGDYMCVASTVFGAQGGSRITAASFSPTVTIYSIRVDTFIDTQPVFKAADEYSYTKLECANQGKVVGDDIAYNWYKDDKSQQVEMDNGRLYVDHLGTLHFTFVKRTDATTVFTYLCGISSTTEKILRFGSVNNLQVKEAASPTPVKPLLQYSNDGVLVNLYSKATLECVFSGYDPQPPYIPKIKWSMDDGREISSGGKYTISSDGRTLTILSVSEQDEKNYYCSAENSAGTVPPQPVLLNVTSAPIFVDGGPRDQTVSEGKDVVFSCDARSASNEQAPSAPNWYINGEATGPHTDRTKFVIENKKLTVKGVNKARDILCVQCSVTNARGTTWGDGCLNVLLPITITQQPALEQNIDHGDVIDLTIKATTDEAQTLVYKWLHFQNKSTTVGVDPNFLIIDPVTHATIINTSLLSEKEYETVGGIYRRVISHTFDSINVDVHVVLKDKPEPDVVVAESAGIDMWIIGLIIGILFLIIVIIIIIFVICRKQQEGDYNVDKKETRAGLDPEKELKDKGFSEYSRPAYEDYDYPDKKPRVDLEYDDGPIGDDESLGEYGDEEDTHFNEDGSFIGIYQKKDPQQKPPQTNESTI